jgi:hypothetical protein
VERAGLSHALQSFELVQSTIKFALNSRTIPQETVQSRTFGKSRGGVLNSLSLQRGVYRDFLEELVSIYLMFQVLSKLSSASLGCQIELLKLLDLRCRWRLWSIAKVAHQLAVMLIHISENLRYDPAIASRIEASS